MKQQMRDSHLMSHYIVALPTLFIDNYFGSIFYNTPVMFT